MGRRVWLLSLLLVVSAGSPALAGDVHKTIIRSVSGVKGLHRSVMRVVRHHGTLSFVERCQLDAAFLMLAADLSHPQSPANQRAKRNGKSPRLVFQNDSSGSFALTIAHSNASLRGPLLYTERVAVNAKTGEVGLRRGEVYAKDHKSWLRKALDLLRN